MAAFWPWLLVIAVVAGRMGGLDGGCDGSGLPFSQPYEAGRWIQGRIDVDVQRLASGIIDESSDVDADCD